MAQKTRSASLNERRFGFLPEKEMKKAEHGTNQVRA